MDKVEIQEGTIKKTNKQPLVAYIASTIILHSIFVATMLRHYNGVMDWEYYGKASIIIIFISLIPAIVVHKVKVSKWYWSIIYGVLLGFIMAVLYVKS